MAAGLRYLWASLLLGAISRPSCGPPADSDTTSALRDFLGDARRHGQYDSLGGLGASSSLWRSGGLTSPPLSCAYLPVSQG